MRTKTVPSGWLHRDGLRLDCRSYMSGALEARVRLEELAARKVPLREVTLGGSAGIFNGPRFARKYVDDPNFGIPFLGSTDILDTDLSHLHLLSRRQVAAIPGLVIHRGWTLITCSGTIGRMAFARPDMDGMAGSQHFMRVVPNPARIPPGYLYAYLTSKFGVSIVIAGTYGAIIQHIEPQHIADLPVPRLGHAFEQHVHALVESAAMRRSNALKAIDDGEQILVKRLALPALTSLSVSEFSTATVRSSSLNYRLDAPYHCKAASEADSAVTTGPFPRRCLADVLRRYFKPPMFKRLWVDTSEYGRQFISGVDAYRFQAETIRYVSGRTPKFEEFILEEGTVVFQAAGQIYGLFGRPLLVTGWLTGLFAADDLYRLVPQSPEDGGYLYGFLRTTHGQVLLKRQACGKSIPRIWDPHMRDIFIPWPDDELRAELGVPFLDAHRQLEAARCAENEAIELVERAIEAGTY